MRLVAEGPAAAATTRRRSFARRCQIGPTQEKNINQRCRLNFLRRSESIDNRRGASTRARAEPGRRLPAADAAADVAVFRFTLGIPGLDDALVPRIIGVLALLGLAANRVFSGGGGGGGGEALLGSLSAVPPSQARAEAVAAALAFAACAVPTVERLIADAEPGRGRKALAAIPGSEQAFRVATTTTASAPASTSAPPRRQPQRRAVAEEASGDPIASELAWASYALLRNANCCTVVVLKLDSGTGRGDGGGRRATALVVRGALPPSVASSSSGPLSAAAEAFSPTSSLDSAVLGRGEALYVSDATSATASGELGGGGRGPWGVLPAGAGCALAQPIFSSEKGRGGGGGDGGGGDGGTQAAAAGLLLLAGDRPRALSVRDRAWAREIARKLSRVL